MSEPQISRHELRGQLRKLDGGALFEILYRAVDLLSVTQLVQLTEGYIPLKSLHPTESTPAGLIETVEAFHAESLRGCYYESFDVNSKNFMEESRGTQLWMAEISRLLDLTLSIANEGAYGDAGRAFDLLFDVLQKVDECTDEILFFADEGGAWEVHVEWNKVLPAWFRCMASTAADDYAEKVTKVIDAFRYRQRETWLRKARAAATPEQKAAFDCE